MEIETPAQKLLYTTVLMETETPDGKKSLGTSFFFGYEDDLGILIVLVTNKHVVENTKSGKFSFFVSQNDVPIIGEKVDFTVPNFAGLWHFHPNENIDIAILPVVEIIDAVNKASILYSNSIGQKIPDEVFFRYFDQENIPDEETVNRLDALEDIFFAGYPNGIFDSVNLLPIIRRGTSASPIGMDFGGSPLFLIDASVFPGSSGSPVVSWNFGAYRSNRTPETKKSYLLGVVSSVYYMEDEGIIIGKNYHQVDSIFKTREMLDLGLVFKSHLIIETIENYIESKKPQK